MLVVVGAFPHVEFRGVRPDFGRVVFVHAVVGVGRGKVHLLNSIPRLQGDCLVRDGQRVAVAELVEGVAPAVLVDARGGQVLQARRLHGLGDKLHAFGEVVGKHRLAALRVLLGLRENRRETDYVPDFVFIGVGCLVDVPFRRDEARVDRIAQVRAVVVHVGVRAVRNGKRPVGGVLG